MKRFMFAGCVALSAFGCNHDKASDAAPAASAAAAVPAAPAATVAAITPSASAAAADTAPAAPAPVAPAPVAPAVVAAIPAEEDFEPKAATTITAANASQQLAELEKELASK